MRPLSYSRRFRRRGNVLIEFVLAAGMLTLLGFGAADFSRVIAVKTSAQSAANAAANFAAQLTQSEKNCPPLIDTNGIQQAAISAFGSSPAGFQAQVSIKCGSNSSAGTLTNGPCACNASVATYVDVQTSVPFSTVGSYPFFPSGITVRAAALARVQ